MPELLVVVTGTGTEVGKTWMTAEVIRALRARGATVAARKPVQSFAPEDPIDVRDASVLAAATGERVGDVCPAHRSYEVPMAPPMAAAVLDRPSITLAALLDEITWPDGVDVGFVETVGGVRSPIADDADSADLTRALAPDLVVLVADAGLGTINLVRLSIEALAGMRTIVVLNRYDDANDLHRRNRAWLTDRDGCCTCVSADEVARHVLALRPPA